MQIAKLPHRFFDHKLTVPFPTNVSFNCDRSPAEVSNFGHGTLCSRKTTDRPNAILLCSTGKFLDFSDGNIGPSARQCEGDSASNTTCPSSNKCDFSIKR